MRSADFAVFFRPHYCRLAIASLHNVSKLLKKSYYATLRTNQAKCIRFWIFAPIFWFGILLLFFTHCDLARGLMQTWQPIVQWIFIYFNIFFRVLSTNNFTTNDLKISLMSCRCFESSLCSLKLKFEWSSPLFTGLAKVLDTNPDFVFLPLKQGWAHHQQTFLPLQKA